MLILASLDIILPFFVFLVITLLFLLLKGVFSPKLGLPLVALAIAGFAYFCFPTKTAKSVIEKKDLTSKPEATDNSKKKEITLKTTPVIHPEKISKQEALPPKEKTTKKVIRRYLTKVKIEGITNQNTLRQFSEQSGYSVSKKGDYIIKFTYTGSSKQINEPTENNRFIFSGGHLIVKVNEEKCCCATQIPISEGLLLGKTMKMANLILAETIENHVAKNLHVIIPMISECLPQI